ncbi:Trp biosynthesis-associated membrane protein [Cryobacterium sp. 1639]|uniref:Trp biosynthesis-associated membrane protein n=1 Tax=Cryobacterium inferilacus TaxID=2866629 RepID=UPI001C733F75|nr:Trp biosynthesis-associated membrane protein [Cryobacterium sp. 1639]MBX0298426.1 Trp biosynthesis-associated membrane protein [Cryobacterium sp. 1639]
MSPATRTTKRLKPMLILAVIIASGIALLAWTQVWLTVRLAADGTSQQVLDVTGSVAAPGLTALALAGLALAGALTIAGAVIRIILGLLEVLLGASVILSATLAVADPAGVAAAAVTTATGIAGVDSTRAAVDSTALTFWPYLALVAGVLMLLIGLLIVITATRWPGPTSRYDSTRFEPVTDATTGQTRPRDAVDDWDGLTKGNDPTV